MDPREFYELAVELAGETQPACIRSSISRAYYAAFNLGAEMLRGMGFKIEPTSQGHEDVRMRLHNARDSAVKEAAQKLRDLKTSRNHADYKMKRRDIENPKTAKALIENANYVIKVLEKCKSEPLRSQVISDIKEWERRIGISDLSI